VFQRIHLAAGRRTGLVMLAIPPFPHLRNLHKRLIVAMRKIEQRSSPRLRKRQQWFKLLRLFKLFKAAIEFTAHAEQHAPTQMGLSVRRIERNRTSEDKRMSISRITDRSLKLLEEMRPEINHVHGWLADRFSEGEFEQLSTLLERFYAGS